MIVKLNIEAKVEKQVGSEKFTLIRDMDGIPREGENVEIHEDWADLVVDHVFWDLKGTATVNLQFKAIHEGELADFCDMVRELR